MSSLPAWVRHALHSEGERRKVLLYDREVARSGRALPDLLRHFGLDPEQPYSQMHLPDLGIHVYCQPPFDFPVAAEVSKDGRAVWSASVPIAAAPAPGVPVHDHAGDAMTLLTGAAAWARASTLTRILADGRVLDVLPLTFGRARLCVSADVHTLGYDDGW